MRVRIVAIMDKEHFYQAVGALNAEGMSLLSQANYRFEMLVTMYSCFLASYFAFLFSLNNFVKDEF